MATPLPKIAQSRIIQTRTEPTPPTITVSFAMNSLRRWWMVVIPAAFMLSAFAGGVVWYFFEAEYQAEAWIRIDEKAPFIAYQNKERSDRFVETQIGLIKSPMVLTPVAGKPEVARMPEISKQVVPTDWLAMRVSVVPVGQSELYRVRFTGPSAQNATTIVNSIAENYFEMLTQEETARTQRVVEVLEGQKERRSQAVMQLRETVRELSKQTTGKDPFGGNQAHDHKLLQHPAATLQDRLTQAEVEREMLEAQVQVLQDPNMAPQHSIPPSRLERNVDNHPEVVRLKSDLSTLRMMLLETEANAKRPEESATYRRLLKEIETHEKALATTKQKLLSAMSDELASDYESQRKQSMADMQARLATSRLAEQLLRERYTKEISNVKQSTGQSLELAFAMAELSREEKVFELIAARTLELRTEMRAPSRVSLLRRAVVPTAPVEWLPLKKMGLAMSVCFCVPFLLVVGWERMIRRVSDSKQLTQESRFASVWEVASLPSRARIRNRASDRRQAGLFEESVDSLRTGLILSEPMKDMQVLCVTSAISREGKTSLACELAVSIARASGEPTLLIDSDTRSPDIHRIFEVPLEPGLTDLLDDRCTTNDAIVTDWGQGVHILPSGRLHVSPHKLFGSGQLKTLLQELRRTYRYIIIDTPPILPASEALVVAGSSDATLICAKRDLTRVDQLETAYERLSVTGAQPVGVVLNDVPARSYLYSYGRYNFTGGVV